MDGKFSHPHLSVQLCLWRECFKPCLKKTSSSGLLSSAGRREGGGQMGVPRQIPFPIVLPSQLSWTLPLLTVPCCPHPNILIWPHSALGVTGFPKLDVLLENFRKGGGVISDPKNYIADFFGFKTVYFGCKTVELLYHMGWYLDHLGSFLATTNPNIY